jgi:hypothetical protein
VKFVPDASPLDNDAQKSFESDLSWQHLIYGEANSLTHSGVWVTDLDGWTLQVRATYAASDEAAVLQEMSALTALAEKSAGTQLAVCAKSSIPVRDGKPITDKNKIQSILIMRSLIGGAALAAKINTRKRPVMWCDEGLRGTKETPVFLWHAVFDDGSDGQMDKATPVSIEDPPELVSTSDALTTIVLASEKKDPIGGQQWYLQLENGDHTRIFALYDGRVPADILVDTMAGIVNHTATAIGGYGAKGKTLTIDMPENH